MRSIVVPPGPRAANSATAASRIRRLVPSVSQAIALSPALSVSTVADSNTAVGVIGRWGLQSSPTLPLEELSHAGSRRATASCGRSRAEVQGAFHCTAEHGRCDDCDGVGGYRAADISK